MHVAGRQASRQTKQGKAQDRCCHTSGLPSNIWPRGITSQQCSFPALEGGSPEPAASFKANSTSPGLHHDVAKQHAGQVLLRRRAKHPRAQPIPGTQGVNNLMLHAQDWGLCAWCPQPHPLRSSNSPVLPTRVAPTLPICPHVEQNNTMLPPCGAETLNHVAPMWSRNSSPCCPHVKQKLLTMLPPCGAPWDLTGPAATNVTLSRQHARLLAQAQCTQLPEPPPAPAPAGPAPTPAMHPVAVNVHRHAHLGASACLGS